MTTNERQGHEVLAEALNVQTALKTYGFLRQVELMDKGEGVQLMIVNQATGLQLYINSKILMQQLTEEFNKLENYFQERNINLQQDIKAAEKEVLQMFQGSTTPRANGIH